MKTLELGKASIKALSAETRIKILKLLDQRNHTQTEIAQELKLATPSIKEHIEELIKAELIEKLEEGRKWKYFQLTQKGKAILHPEDIKLLIVIGTFAFSVIIGGFAILKEYLQKTNTIQTFAQAKIDSARMMTAAMPTPEPQSQYFGLIIYIIWLLLLIGIIVYLKRKKPN
ncbi:winged helix-turn-helix transcriptional regulator [Candidatus Woesearchaeota archaeon]|nr:winged helix-turn-helix transcriptional regulator [Candidatus Woesearchaeota archaeon]